MNKLGLHRVLIDMPSSARVYRNDLVNIIKWNSMNSCEFQIVSYSRGIHWPKNVVWSGRVHHFEYLGELTVLEKVIYAIK